MRKVRILQLDAGGEKYVPLARSLAQKAPDRIFQQVVIGTDKVKLQVAGDLAYVWIEIAPTGAMWAVNSFWYLAINSAEAQEIAETTWPAGWSLGDIPLRTTGLMLSQAQGGQFFYVTTSGGYWTVLRQATDKGAGTFDPYYPTVIGLDESPAVAPFGYYAPGTFVAGHGGDDGTEQYRELYVYDVGTNSWTSKYAGAPPTIFTSLYYYVVHAGFIYLESPTLTGICQDWDSVTDEVITGGPFTNLDFFNAGDDDYGLSWVIAEGTSTMVSSTNTNTTLYGDISSPTFYGHRLAIYTFAYNSEHFMAGFQCEYNTTSGLVPATITYSTAGGWSALTPVTLNIVTEPNALDQTGNLCKVSYTNADRSHRVGAASFWMWGNSGGGETQVWDIDVINENVFEYSYYVSGTQVAFSSFGSPQDRTAVADFASSGGHTYTVTVRPKADGGTAVAGYRKGLCIRVYMDNQFVGEIEQDEPAIEHLLHDVRLTANGPSLTIDILLDEYGASSTNHEWTGTVTVDVDAVTMSYSSPGGVWGGWSSTVFGLSTISSLGYVGHGRDT